ncbi:MAG: DUF2779 domain-containing protein [Planctomycetes bacterium]|nr:DUF2779 domain-containing protein [Planctomycetota bacterium]
MKKKPLRNSARNLDKPLVEAGMQCKKRLWLDYHRPIEAELTPTRRALAEVGQQLLALARSVFPKGVTVDSADRAAAASETKRLLAEGTPVLFDATFEADGAEVTCDILVQHKDGEVDVYEVKSGTKITQRYLNDVALQVHVLEASGCKLRAAFLLHQNPQYVHQEGAEYPPMQLLKSADVTAKSKKQVPHVAARLASFRRTCDADEVPNVPMGTYCTTPTPCPHFAECAADAPALPAYELPELTRQQEAALQTDGIFELSEIDPQRRGLTFAQRRTIESIRQGETIVEPFVRDELNQCAFPLHFLSIATITDALPRFTGQRPWRRTPHAWAVETLHEDGRVERAAFAHADRTDPRADAIVGLGKHLEIGGTVVCWNCDSIESLRSLLDDLPSAKNAVRAIIGRSLVDLRQLFEAGVFHPALRGHVDLVASVAALLGDDSGKELAFRDEDQLRELLEKAWAPRVRSTTRQKIAKQVEETLDWRSGRMLELFRKFGEFEPKQPRPAKPAARPTKALPKLPEEHG